MVTTWGTHRDSGGQLLITHPSAHTALNPPCISSLSSSLACPPTCFCLMCFISFSVWNNYYLVKPCLPARLIPALSTPLRLPRVSSLVYVHWLMCWGLSAAYHFFACSEYPPFQAWQHCTISKEQINNVMDKVLLHDNHCAGSSQEVCTQARHVKRANS